MDIEIKKELDSLEKRSGGDRGLYNTINFCKTNNKLELLFIANQNNYTLSMDTEIKKELDSLEKR